MIKMYKTFKGKNEGKIGSWEFVSFVQALMYTSNDPV